MICLGNAKEQLVPSKIISFKYQCLLDHLILLIITRSDVDVELTIALLNQILRVGNDHALVTHCHELIQIIIQNICNQDFQGSLIQLEIPYSSKTKGPTQKASQLIKIQSQQEIYFLKCTSLMLIAF